MEKYPFKVVIVGGSVSGLTLAHCLDRAGIDYILLEKHHSIHPQIGASLGILPNGARILDQLGIFEDLEKLALPFQKAHQGFPDGFHYSIGLPLRVKERFGLTFACIERRQFLEVLYTKLADKSKIHVNKKVASINSDESGVTVLTADGTTYQCDLVVGADGVHSTVRSEIWRIANLQQAGYITDVEKSGLSAEFSCVFGISKPVKSSVNRWDHVIRYNKKFTFLVFPASEGRLFWLVISKLDKKYVYPSIPRFSTQEAIDKCESVSEFPIWEDVKFGDIWKQRGSFTMHALEEYLFHTWHYGRMVCIGDSVSKMTPNMGQGANTAVESAAALSNGLRALLNKQNGTQKPSGQDIDALLTKFNSKQLERLSGIHNESRLITRMEACDGPIKTFLARHIAPYCGDLVSLNVARVVTNGVVLDYVPLTERLKNKWKPLAQWETWGMAEARDFGNKLLAFIAVVLIPILLCWAMFNSREILLRVKLDFLFNELTA
ncbi:hypothetical protein FQN49_001277 [Arthroderma sp. PD_2]|nr:hypothetical protein FQN49_001277 [Arthroderma sp. PD_2]